MRSLRLIVCSAALLAFPAQLLAQYGFASGVRFQNIDFANENFSGFNFTGRTFQPVTTQPIRFSPLTFGGFSSASRTTAIASQSTEAAPAADSPTHTLRERSHVVGEGQTSRTIRTSTDVRRHVSIPAQSVRDRHFSTAIPSSRSSRRLPTGDTPRARYVIH